MAAMEWFTTTLHRKIDSVVIHMGKRLCEARMPNKLSLHKELATSNVCTLAEIHTTIIPPIIPPILQPLPIPLPLAFNIFVNDNEPETIEANRGEISSSRAVV